MLWRGSWCWGNRDCVAVAERITTPPLVILAQARIHAGWMHHWIPAFAGKTAMEICDCSKPVAGAQHAVSLGR